MAAEFLPCALPEIGDEAITEVIDPATLNIDPAAIEAAITPRTKAMNRDAFDRFTAKVPSWN